MICRFEKCWPHLVNFLMLTRSVEHDQDISTMILPTLGLNTNVFITFQAFIVKILQTVVFWIWHSVVLEWILPLIFRSEGYVSVWHWSDLSQVLFQHQTWTSSFNPKHANSMLFHNISNHLQGYIIKTQQNTILNVFSLWTRKTTVLWKT